MKALFTFLQTNITSNLPAIKTVRMWNNQIDHSNDTSKRDEKPFVYPAVFLEFIVQDVENAFSLGIKNVKLIIRCRFALKSFTYTRLQDLDFADAFDAVMTQMRGDPTDTVQFSTLQEVSTELDEQFENVNAPYVDYVTMWRKTSAYTHGTDVTKSGVAKLITAQKVITLP